MEINLNFVVIIRTEGKKSSKYPSLTYSYPTRYRSSKTHPLSPSRQYIFRPRPYVKHCHSGWNMPKPGQLRERKRERESPSPGQASITFTHPRRFIARVRGRNGFTYITSVKFDKGGVERIARGRKNSWGTELGTFSEREGGRLVD